MLDYIKQLEHQNEELQKKLARSEYNNERLKRKGHIAYALRGRLQVPDPGFSADYTLITSYELCGIVNHLGSILKSDYILYKDIEVKATYNFKSRDFLQDHVPGDGDWYKQSVWILKAHLIDKGIAPHRHFYAISNYFFNGLPKKSLKDIRNDNLVDYLKKHIR